MMVVCFLVFAIITISPLKQRPQDYVIIISPCSWHRLFLFGNGVRSTDRDFALFRGKQNGFVAIPETNIVFFYLFLVIFCPEINKHHPNCKMGCSPLNVRYQPTVLQTTNDRHGAQLHNGDWFVFCLQKRVSHVLICSMLLFVNTPILKGKYYMLHAFSELTWGMVYNSSQSASSGLNHNRIIDFCVQFSVGGESSCPRMKKQRSTIC